MAEAIRATGVTELMYYRWRAEYGGLKLDQVRRLKQLEQDNGRLRRAISDLTLERLILNDETAKRVNASENFQASRVVALPWSPSRQGWVSRNVLPAGCWTSTLQAAQDPAQT